MLFDQCLKTKAGRPDCATCINAIDSVKLGMMCVVLTMYNTLVFGIAVAFCPPDGLEQVCLAVATKRPADHGDSTGVSVDPSVYIIASGIR
jgi:hypothetical protein